MIHFSVRHVRRHFNCVWMRCASDRAFDCFVIGRTGSITNISLTFEDFKRDGLHARDFFALDLFSDISSCETQKKHSNSTLITPFLFLPRPGCIIVSMGNMKSIIYADRLLVFNPNRPVVKQWSNEVCGRIHEFPEDSSSTSFELCILEEILKEMCEMFDRRLRLFTPLAENLLLRIDNEFDAFEGVQKLVPLQDGMQAFEIEVREARENLLKMLENDDDMRALLLSSSVRKCPSESEVAVELLLESYAARLSHLLHSITYIQQKMVSRSQMAQMSMTMQRNRIMRMNLHTSIGAITLAFCSVVTGVFGMNLPSGLEETHGLFIPAVMVTLAGSALIHGTMLWTIFGGGLKRKYEQEVGYMEAMKRMLSDMGSLDHAVKTAFACIDGSSVHTKYVENLEKSGNEDSTHRQSLSSRVVSKALFRELIQEARIGAPKRHINRSIPVVDEVDVFFDLMDTDGDGLLESHEINKRRSSSNVSS